MKPEEHEGATDLDRWTIVQQESVEPAQTSAVCTDTGIIPNNRHLFSRVEPCVKT